MVLTPNWDLPSEMKIGGSDYAVGVVLGHRKGMIFQVVHYARKVLNEAHVNYTIIEKELLVVVLTFDKFHSYLIGSKVIVYINHVAIKYFSQKKYAKPQLLRWFLLLKEFDVEIYDKGRAQNLVTSHLSRLESTVVKYPKLQIVVNFPDEQLWCCTSTHGVWMWLTTYPMDHFLLI